MHMHIRISITTRGTRGARCTLNVVCASKFQWPNKFWVDAQDVLYEVGCDGAAVDGASIPAVADARVMICKPRARNMPE